MHALVPGKRKRTEASNWFGFGPTSGPAWRFYDKCLPFPRRDRSRICFEGPLYAACEDRNDLVDARRWLRRQRGGGGRVGNDRADGGFGGCDPAAKRRAAYGIAGSCQVRISGRLRWLHRVQVGKVSHRTLPVAGGAPGIGALGGCSLRTGRWSEVSEGLDHGVPHTPIDSTTRDALASGSNERRLEPTTEGHPTDGDQKRERRARGARNVVEFLSARTATPSAADDDRHAARAGAPCSVGRRPRSARGHQGAREPEEGVIGSGQKPEPAFRRPRRHRLPPVLANSAMLAGLGPG
jgi:hypothetical protein